jgi:hypothetical protein
MAKGHSARSRQRGLHRRSRRGNFLSNADFKLESLAMRLFALTLLPALALANPVLAQSCADPAAVTAARAGLESSYNDVLSDISCDAPTLPAHQILCDDPLLWDMEVLNTWAWVYATENATGQETDHGNPPRDADVLARRDACTDAACLCDVLIEKTNESLGGMSPYPQ